MVNVIQLGMPPSEDVIQLGKPRKKTRRLKLAESLTKGVSKTIGSTKLTPFLAGTLGLITGGPLLGAKAFLGTGLGVGVLEKSPLARKEVRKTLKDPTRVGRFVGETGEKIITGKLDVDIPTKERVKEGLKKAGLIGGVAGLVAGGVAVAKKVKKTPIPTLPALPSLITPQISKIPAQVPPQVEPIGVVKPKEAPKEALVSPQLPTINNRISVRPEINVTVKNIKRKFINQQILLN